MHRVLYIYSIIKGYKSSFLSMVTKCNRDDSNIIQNSLFLIFFFAKSIFKLSLMFLMTFNYSRQTSSLIIIIMQSITVHEPEKLYKADITSYCAKTSNPFKRTLLAQYLSMRRYNNIAARFFYLKRLLWYVG